jgi:hypothetical protein
VEERVVEVVRRDVGVAGGLVLTFTLGVDAMGSMVANSITAGKARFLVARAAALADEGADVGKVVGEVGLTER